MEEGEGVTHGDIRVVTRGNGRHTTIVENGGRHNE